MRARVEMVGGTLIILLRQGFGGQVESAPAGQGTTMRAEIPFRMRGAA
jgi:signal transduction histidine kinase